MGAVLGYMGEGNMNRNESKRRIIESCEMVGLDGVLWELGSFGDESWYCVMNILMHLSLVYLAHK